MSLFALGVSEDRVRFAGTIRWTIHEGWKERIIGPDAPDWSNLEGDPRATLVKSNPIRRIWRVSLSDGALYVKEFLEISIGSMLRRFLHSGPALREWRAGQAAAQRDVPCVRFVACGLGRRCGFLVSQEVAGAVAVADAWLCACHISDEGLRKQRTNALVDAVARLLARAHHNGFLHGDDHPRNMLVVERDQAVCAVTYVDVQRARWMADIPVRLAVGSLAQLHQWFQLRASRTGRLRFLRTYCLERTQGRKQAAQLMMRRMVPAIASATYAQMARLWAKRDRRIGGTNEYFARLRLKDGSVAMVVLRIRQPDLFPSPSIPNRTSDQWRAVLKSRAGENGTGPISRHRHQEQDRLIVGPVPFSPRWWIRGSPFSRAFVSGHRLRNRDLPCRCPLAIVERVTPGRESTSRLLLDKYPVTVDLVSFLKPDGSDRAQRRRVLASLGKLVSLMADRGASVPRPTVSTFGVAVDSLRVIIEGPSDVVLRSRDVERDRFATVQGLHGLFRGAAAFNRGDALRFLRTLTPRNWKRLWRTIERDPRRRIR